MIKNVLTETGGVAIYGILSVCLFFTVFGMAVIRALRMRKSAVDRASRLPFEDGSIETDSERISHD